MKYQRLVGTHVAMYDEDSELGDASSDVSSETKGGDMLIPHETVKREWSLGELSDRALLKAISDATHCSLAPKPDKKTITVKGEDITQVNKALAKLDAVWKSTTQSLLLPMVYDLECTEGELKVMLQLLPLKELKDRRLTTTLISPSSRLVKNIGSHYCVIMIKDGNVYPTGQPRALDRSNSLEVTSKLWANTVSKPYQAKAVDENAFVKASLATATEKLSNPFLPPKKTGEINQWVEQSAAQSASDPFAPPLPPSAKTVPQGTNQSNPSSVQPQEPSTERVSPRKRAGRIRKPKGAAEEMPLDAGDVTASAETTPLNIQSCMRDVAIESAETFPARAHAATLSTSSVDLAGNKIDSPTVSKNGQTDINIPELVATPSIDTTPSIKTGASSTRHPNHRELPALQPPYMPAVSTTSTSTSRNPSWATVTSVKEGHLIDFTTSPTPEEASKDRTQNKKEIPLRQIKNTMRQRKPSPLVGRGSTGATAAYDKIAAQLFELVRSAPGVVSIETAIGRLLIDPRSGSGEYKKTRFAIVQWPLVFPNKDGMVKLMTTFTERLTSLASDADFVLDLKMPSGRRMFTEQPCQRKILYRFTCSTSHKSEDDMIVDFDEKETPDGTYTVSKAPKLYGAMNWHYPKRYWDAHLAVNVSDQDVSHDQRLAVQEIVSNLQVSPIDLGAVQLTTVSPHKALPIQAIQLRRETHHRSSLYPDLVLKLCECQDFEMELPRPEVNDHCRAYTNSRKQMVHENRLWWEASIASGKATKLVEQNKTLEIGEKTGWTAKDIIDADVVRNMSFLARDVVTGIDSVGYHNKGPKAASTKEQSETPATTVGFW